MDLLSKSTHNIKLSKSITSLLKKTQRIKLTIDNTQLGLQMDYFWNENIDSRHSWLSPTFPNNMFYKQFFWTFKKKMCPFLNQVNIINWTMLLTCPPTFMNLDHVLLVQNGNTRGVMKSHLDIKNECWVGKSFTLIYLWL